MQPTLTPEALIRKHWPFVREIYISPLSRGDDVISAWQAEAMVIGGETIAMSGPTLDAALEQLDFQITVEKAK